MDERVSLQEQLRAAEQRLARVIERVNSADRALTLELAERGREQDRIHEIRMAMVRVEKADE